MGAPVVDVLQSLPGYVADCKKVFGRDKVDIDKVIKAIAAFEKVLVTPDSRLDKWLK